MKKKNFLPFRLLVCLPLFINSFSLFAFDRLAADPISAQYRTGQIDPVVFSIPKDLETKWTKNPAMGLPDLVTYLTKETNDEFLKVKRIHDWITESIAYDSDLLLGLSDDGSKKVDQLLSLRRSTCGGFASLFQKMAELANLEVQKITGNSKTCWIKKSNRDCHHVWNGVKIKGVWYVVDTTADSRFTYKYGSFTKKKSYKDNFLFINPNAKLLINLPLEENQQFKNNPMSKGDFFKIPRVTILYYKYDIQYSEETISKFREERKDFEGGGLQKIHDAVDENASIYSLKFIAPDNIIFRPQIISNPEESFDDESDVDKNPSFNNEQLDSDLAVRSFCFRESKNNVLCQFSAPKTGRFKVYLQAREAGDQKKFGLVHAFNVNFSASGPILPLEANRFYPNPLFSYQGFKLINQDLIQNQNLPFVEVENPNENFITSFVYRADGNKIPSSVEYSYLSKKRIRFYYKLPTEDNLSIKLLTRIPNETGGNLQTMNMARLSGTGNLNFPPNNDVIFTKLFSEENLKFENTEYDDQNRILMIRISGISNQKVDCDLYDEKGKLVKKQCDVIKDRDKTEIQFLPNGMSKFSGRIYLNSDSGKKIIGYFRWAL